MTCAEIALQTQEWPSLILSTMSYCIVKGRKVNRWLGLNRAWQAEGMP